MYPSKRQGPAQVRSKRAPSRLLRACAPSGDASPQSQPPASRVAERIADAPRSEHDRWLSASILAYDRSLSAALRERDELRVEYESVAAELARERSRERRSRGAQVLLGVLHDQQARRRERLRRAERTCQRLHEGFVAIMREALTTRDA